VKEKRLVASFYLDKNRYRDAKPSGVKIQLRRKEKNTDDILSSRWSDNDDGFRINLPYQIDENNIYSVSVQIPSGEWSQYAIDIYADIEPGWATNQP